MSKKNTLIPDFEKQQKEIKKLGEAEKLLNKIERINYDCECNSYGHYCSACRFKEEVLRLIKGEKEWKSLSLYG